MKSTPSLPISSSFKRLLLFCAALNGLVGVKQIIESFFSSNIFKKDFISPYLMGKAISAGINPYLPLPELANFWMSYASYNRFQHPTPHPPVVGLVGLPFGVLSYEKAAFVWLILEIICLSVTVFLFHRWWYRSINITSVALVSGLALGWMPVIEDLWFGQFSLCLLVLLVGAWLTLRSGKEVLGGSLLGGLIIIKLVGWPIVIFLALRRRWVGVISVGVVAIIGHLLAAIVMGGQIVKDYYFKIGPQIASIYRTYDCNFSTWTLGTRLFDGFGYFFWAPPLWESQYLAYLTNYVTPIAVLLLGLVLASKASNFDASISFLIGAGILVNPIAWPHYLLFVSIPLLVILRRLCSLGWPRKESYTVGFLWLLMSSPMSLYNFIIILRSSQTTSNGLPIVSFPIALITLIPAAALIGLLWVLWCLDNVRLPEGSHVASVEERQSLPGEGFAKAI